MRKLDLVGKKFGRLQVVNFSHINVFTYFSCKCDCGNEITVMGANLKSGRVTSCGCLNKEIVGNRFKKSNGISSANIVYKTYIKDAKDRNLSFNLSREQFNKLTQMNCYYCNIQPSNIKKSRYGNGDFVYNGIDRIDNTNGYEPSNCVSSCMHCNRGKMSKTEDEFYSWIKNIYEYRKLMELE